MAGARLGTDPSHSMPTIVRGSVQINGMRVNG